MSDHIQALEQFSYLFTQDDGYLRIPIWGHIPLSRAARRIIEHPDFVRLQRIRQLGFVYYVFPGASHTRFEHSIGAFYLSVQMLQRLVLNPVNWYDAQTPKISPDDGKLFLAAALLHDIGHYPFAHLVDRLTVKNTNNQGVRHPAFNTHEQDAWAYILGSEAPGSLYAILKEEWGIADPSRVVDVIAKPSKSGLTGRMLSGILDPDKMDYLMRDAWNCGVPYGNIDTDRLIESLVLDVEEPHSRLGITEKGVAPLESLVFAKYMMFRHIYWHHAVRSAVAMFTRFIQDGLDEGTMYRQAFYSLSDDALIHELSEQAEAISSGELMRNLENRRLYKRGLTFYPEYAPGEEEFVLNSEEMEQVKGLYFWPERRKQKETAICDLLSKEEGMQLKGFEVLLDVPRITSVFDIEDFRELRVLITSQVTRESKFVPFDSCGFTQLTADFAQEFERFSRRVHVFCRPDLRDALIRYRNQIKAIVSE